MGKKAKAPAKTSKLVAHNFLPALSKPNSVIGDYISKQGKEWAAPAAEGAPAPAAEGAPAPAP